MDKIKFVYVYVRVWTENYEYCMHERRNRHTNGVTEVREE